MVACEELVNIVEARAAELLMYIKQYALDPDNWLQRAAAGIVITGGGTNMEGFRELAQRTFMLPVRQGSPQPLGQGPCNCRLRRMQRLSVCYMRRCADGA